MPLRYLPWFIAPIAAFAIVVWGVLCILFGFSGQERTAESAGILALIAAPICGASARRLYPGRTMPEWRAGFLLNAAGLTAILVWFALSLLIPFWQYLIHRGAQ